MPLKDELVAKVHFANVALDFPVHGHDMISQPAICPLFSVTFVTSKSQDLLMVPFDVLIQGSFVHENPFTTGAFLLLALCCL